LNAFTQEELAENDTDSVYLYEYMDPEFTNAREEFFNDIYDNERDVSISEKEGYPANFDAYLRDFENYYFGNVCEFYYGD